MARGERAQEPAGGARAGETGGDQGVLSLLRQGVTQSSLELMAAYGMPSTESSPGAADEPGSSQSVYFGIAPFGGLHFSGYVILGATENVLRRSNHTTSSASDWMAELANQFFGRIKNHLMREGIHIQRIPPAVLKGRASLCGANVGPPLVVFANHGDIVWIWLDSERSIEPPEMLAPIETDVLAEGDMILF